MRSVQWGETGHSEFRVLKLSFPIAILIEVFVLAVLGSLQRKSLSVPAAPKVSENAWVEAQIYEMPERAHLVESRKTPVSVTQQEVAIHPRATQAQAATTSRLSLDQENQTEQGPAIPRDHGPIPIFHPKPVLPAYLEYQDTAQSVVVIFEVSADGLVNPRLVISSGHEEIDAVILETLRKWKFQPEVRDGKPVNSRFRTRIEVIPS